MAITAATCLSALRNYRRWTPQRITYEVESKEKRTYRNKNGACKVALRAPTWPLRIRHEMATMRRSKYKTKCMEELVLRILEEAQGVFVIN